MEEGDGGYDLCGDVIGFAMKVHSALGPGFLESVYRNALAIELRRADYAVEAERPFEVRYLEELVGAFAADSVVNGRVIVELKAAQCLTKIHEVQVVNYLTATGIEEGLLLNFGAAWLEYKKKFRLRKPEPVTL